MRWTAAGAATATIDCGVSDFALEPAAIWGTNAFGDSGAQLADTLKTSSRSAGILMGSGGPAAFLLSLPPSIVYKF
jgi:hypothetical protein